MLYKELSSALVTNLEIWFEEMYSSTFLSRELCIMLNASTVCFSAFSCDLKLSIFLFHSVNFIPTFCTILSSVSLAPSWDFFFIESSKIWKSLLSALIWCSNPFDASSFCFFLVASIFCWSVNFFMAALTLPSSKVSRLLGVRLLLPPDAAFNFILTSTSSTLSLNCFWILSNLELYSYKFWN